MTRKVYSVFNWLSRSQNLNLIDSKTTQIKSSSGWFSAEGWGLPSPMCSRPWSCQPPASEDGLVYTQPPSTRILQHPTETQVDSDPTLEIEGKGHDLRWEECLCPQNKREHHCDGGRLPAFSSCMTKEKQTAERNSVPRRRGQLRPLRKMRSFFTKSLAKIPPLKDILNGITTFAVTIMLGNK